MSFSPVASSLYKGRKTVLNSRYISIVVYTEYGGLRGNPDRDILNHVVRIRVTKDFRKGRTVENGRGQ